MTEFAKSPKTIDLLVRPTAEEISQYWGSFFLDGSPRQPHHTWVASEFANRRRKRGVNEDDVLYELLTEVGYLRIRVPPPTDAGAEEYEEIMKGQILWASTRTNSGN